MAGDFVLPRLLASVRAFPGRATLRSAGGQQAWEGRSPGPASAPYGHLRPRGASPGAAQPRWAGGQQAWEGRSSGPGSDPLGHLRPRGASPPARRPSPSSARSDPRYAQESQGPGFPAQSPRSRTREPCFRALLVGPWPASLPGGGEDRKHHAARSFLSRPLSKKPPASYPGRLAGCLAITC